MNRSQPSPPPDEPPRPRQAPFGGWADYQQWAENEFTERTGTTPFAGGPHRRRRYIKDLRNPEVLRLASLPDRSADYMGLRRIACDVPPDADRVVVGDDEPELSLVRPYVRSGGRASPPYELQVETMVSAKHTDTPADEPETITPEHLRIRKLCQHPLSVAEVADKINAPLGVAQVLISDAFELGLVTVHGAGSAAANGRPPLELLSRVRDGLLKGWPEK